MNFSEIKPLDSTKNRPEIKMFQQLYSERSNLARANIYNDSANRENSKDKKSAKKKKELPDKCQATKHAETKIATNPMDILSNLHNNLKKVKKSKITKRRN